MDKQLTWPEFRALEQLKVKGETLLKVSERPYFKYLLREGYLYSRRNKLYAADCFVTLYEEERFGFLYERYATFLADNNLLSYYKRFSEFEIRAMITMKQSPVILEELKKKIEEGQEGRKGISNLFFKSAKYIQKGSALDQAVLSLLGVDEYKQNDNQGFYRVPCVAPRGIILCENMYFLTLDIARKMDVELWCVGGNNVKPLEHLDKIDYPIYYLCDWDYHGLEIYQRIYRIIENTRCKISSLQLLLPNGKREKIVETENQHRSQWKRNLYFSDLESFLYTDIQKELILKLIQNNEWIEEESNNLSDLIERICFNSPLKVD